MPRIEDQDECIQHVSAAIREKSPNGVYNNKAPCASVVSQVNESYPWEEGFCEECQIC